MTFGLKQAFAIDGELAASSREESFTLGVEWGIAWGKARGAPGFAFQVHAANAARITALLTEQGRKFSAATSAGWTSFTVLGLD